jgi:hypothetical protein
MLCPTLEEQYNTILYASNNLKYLTAMYTKIDGTYFCDEQDDHARSFLCSNFRELAMPRSSFQDVELR